MKLQLKLAGIDCGACALKIEKEIQKIDGVADVSLDFASETLALEVLPERRDEIMERADEIVQNFKPSAVLSKSPRPAERQEADIRTVVDRALLAAGGAVFAAGLILKPAAAYELALFFAAYLMIGHSVLFKAVRNVIRGQVFDENFLMGIATAGAFAIGEYPEAAAVMLFYRIGELLQNAAVGRSRKSISSLLDIRPEYANIKSKDGFVQVPPDKVLVGDIILVKAGEKVPLDGRVIKGSASLDTSALSGESAPYDVGEGGEVLAGSVNLNGVLTIEVTKPFGESVVLKILDLVQNAALKKARTENFITRFARVYTPVVVFLALALAVIPPLVSPGADLFKWINRALVFLVVSCPCALVVSVPLSYFGGIGGASRRGILVKGSSFLDALTQVDTVVFDKTGTLTKGAFKVGEIRPAEGFTEDELLEIAAYAEAFSPHPIGLSIQKAFGEKIDLKRVLDSEVISGKGVRSVVDGDEVLAGNAALMEEYGVDLPDDLVGQGAGTAVFVAVNRVFTGLLMIEDEIKPDSAVAVEEIRALDVKNIAMLTGDRRQAAKRAADALGLDAVYSGLLPHQKVEVVEKLMDGVPSSGKLVFVGDGINDAPVLARADIGIAMGALGSDAAIEAADVVLMTDEPSKVAEAMRIAKKTRRIVLQNVALALSAKIIILLLGAFGLTTMWAAVFGDVGVTLIAVLNSIRTLGRDK